MGLITRLRLFDSMVSVRKATKAKMPASAEQAPQPHLGLGLYIARLITEFHQGSITIENNSTSNSSNNSQAERQQNSANSGVTVTLTLPFVA